MKTDNELIAEFMDWTDTGNKGVQWDWLMEVVEKIETDSGVSIVGGPVKKPTCVIHLSTLKAISGQGNTKIEAVYKAVVEFIKWYNNGKVH